MIKTVCVLCNKSYDIDGDDYQYRQIKSKKSTAYVCRACGQMLQKEAIKSSGINPHDLEPKVEQLQDKYTNNKVYR